ncbi:hypothetical protein P3X46_005029 [Hevea brasiliensis]|uniref:Uncharacterized protein n=1 Tax=Hevea brasiliensis TaxID=3981 RepID=A0ABQ9MYK7_HEVBR|nr:hypothetical protein P3X46_005029 [Hevea brasiliensis]
MASGQERAELDARAKQGETVVPGGTGGKSLEALEHLAEGFHEMGRKGSLSSIDKSGGEHAAEEGIEIDESKYRTHS